MLVTEICSVAIAMLMKGGSEQMKEGWLSVKRRKESNGGRKKTNLSR